MSNLRARLQATAKETLSVLPEILDHLGPTVTKYAHGAIKYTNRTLPRLNPNDSPRHRQPATIKVLNADTLNAAIQLMSTSSSPNPPAVLSFANHRVPGGAWKAGAMAQEEALCYRTSLALSLDPSHYPLKTDEALFSPYVLIIRGDLASGHELLRVDNPADFPVVAVLTVAAVHKPAVKTFLLAPPDEDDGDVAMYDEEEEREKEVFADDGERDVTKGKMRLALRMAARNGHDTLVLGALGCGVFGNPAEDVAHCWLEVLREDEFADGWWEEVWFAVYDPRGEGNFEVFDRVLSGQQV